LLRSVDFVKNIEGFSELRKGDFSVIRFWLYGFRFVAIDMFLLWIDEGFLRGFLILRIL
jgi:hypothetical protein